MTNQQKIQSTSKEICLKTCQRKKALEIQKQFLLAPQNQFPYKFVIIWKILF